MFEYKLLPQDDVFCHRQREWGALGFHSVMVGICENNRDVISHLYGPCLLLGNHRVVNGQQFLEIEDMIDENASLITYIMTEFQTQAIEYLTIPNAKSQLPLTN